ncbi:zinc finger CCCH domain-containing protein 48-like [Trifolium pratense]|uniref:Zinc finger CCCH domain-containing protein 48-like n=2 Tax=Trifolium pratense TaxID=57577 RepID=A0A2K3PH82_TRIPR|nr:zinc finger CCCH domain-containing protein 48-like [Trifolium pratense]CAJ2679591.1 unnamed protein product [Trifolium pratense]
MAFKVSRASKIKRIIPTTYVYWLAGKCNRNPCRFLHTRTSSSCNAASTNAGYQNPQKRHSSSTGVLHTDYHSAKKHHSSSYVYQKQTVLNKKIGDDKDRTQTFYGDGFTTITKFQGHNKLITGMKIPPSSDKLYIGSIDGTVRTWDY